MGRDGWQISVLLPSDCKSDGTGLLSDYKSDGTGSSRYRTFGQGNRPAVENR